MAIVIKQRQPQGITLNVPKVQGISLAPAQQTRGIPLAAYNGPRYQDGTLPTPSTRNWFQRNLLDPFNTAAAKSINTVGAGVTGLVGLGEAGYESLFGSSRDYQNKLNETRGAINDILSHGVGDVGAFATPEQANNASLFGDAQQRADFIKPTLKAVADIAPYVVPGGKIAEGASLPIRFLANAGTNAGISGGLTAGSELVNDDKVNWGDVVRSSLTGGVVGGTLGSIRLKGRGKTAPNKITAPDEVAPQTIPITVKPGPRAKTIEVNNLAKRADDIRTQLKSMPDKNTIGRAVFNQKQRLSEILRQPNVKSDPVLRQRVIDRYNQSRVTMEALDKKRQALSDELESIKQNPAYRAGRPQEFPQGKPVVSTRAADDQLVQPGRTTTLAPKKPSVALKAQPRSSVTVDGKTDSLGNILRANRQKAEKTFGSAEADKIGREYNEGLNQTVQEYKDLRSDKSKEGLDIIGEIWHAGDKKPRLVVYTIDHTTKTLAAKAKKEAEIQRRLAELDNTEPSHPTQTATSVEVAKQRNKKIQQVHVLANKLGLTREQYQALAKRVTGKTSSKDMTPEQLTAFADALNPKVKRSAPVSMKQGPSALKRALISSRGVLSNFGKAGKEIARRIWQQRENSEVAQAAFYEKIPTVLKLKHKEFEQFVDALDSLAKGEKIPRPSDEVVQAIREWTKAIPEIRDRAIQAGLEVGDLGKYYFPREYKGLMTRRGMKTMATDMVRTGRAKNLSDAMNKLEFMQREYTRPYGHLETSRLSDLPGYEKTHDALLSYVSRSFDRITKAEQFGPKNETLNTLRALVQRDGHDVSENSPFNKTLKVAIGDVDYNTAGHKVSRGVRKFNAFTRLSKTAITNASQPSNIAIEAGTLRTLKGAVKALASKNARAGAKRSGVLLDHAVNDVARQMLGTGGRISRNVASPMFQAVEKFNRTTSAIVGKDWGNSLAKRAARGSSRAEAILREKLNVTGDIGERLTPAQEIQAARALTESTQFKVDPQDLSAWMDTPIGKVAMQFRTFGYKQTGFIYNQVLREALHGNFMPLTRLVLVGAPVGAAVLGLKGLINGRPVNTDDKKKLLLSGLDQIGAGGLPESEISNLVTSSNYGNTAEGVMGLVAGPTGSTVGQTASNIDKLNQGNSRPLQKELVGLVPAVGSTVASRLYKPNAAAQVYYDTRDTATKGLSKNDQALFTQLTKSTSSMDNKQVQGHYQDLFANPKVLSAIVRQKRLYAQKTGEPLDPLYGKNITDKQRAEYFHLQSLSYKGYDYNQQSKANESWLKPLEDARSKFFDNNPLPDDVDPVASRVPYPNFSDQVQSAMTTASSLTGADKAQFIAAHPEVQQAYDAIAQYTNDKRVAQGNAPFELYPAADPDVQASINDYMALPSGTGARSRWITAHPEAYKAMQDYFTNEALYQVYQNAAQGKFGDAPNQQLLKAAYSLGQYDIIKNPDGTYSLGDSYEGGDSGGYSSGYGSGSGGYVDYNEIKYLGNPDRLRIQAPSGKIKKANSVSLTKGIGTAKKFKVKQVKLTKSKVALKKSKV